MDPDESALPIGLPDRPDEEERDACSNADHGDQQAGERVEITVARRLRIGEDGR